MTYVPPDAGPIIDAGIRQYLHSPQVVQALRATLRHAAIAVAFEQGRAIKTARLVELIDGAEPLEDEAMLLDALKRFVERSMSASDAVNFRQIVADEVARQVQELKIVRNDA